MTSKANKNLNSIFNPTSRNFDIVGQVRLSKGGNALNIVLNTSSGKEFISIPKSDVESILSGSNFIGEVRKYKQE